MQSKKQAGKQTLQKYDQPTDDFKDKNHTMQSQKQADKKRLWVDNQPMDARRPFKQSQKHSKEEALGGQSADRCQKTTPVPTMQSYNTPMKVVSVLSESEDGRRNARSWQKHAPAEYRRKGLQPRWSLRK